MIYRILWIEGKRAQSPPLIPALRKKGFKIEIVSTGAAALARLPELGPDAVVLDIASMRTSGRRICQSLRQRSNGLPIVVIKAHEQSGPDKDCVNVILELPFTWRKLVNRLTRLLPGEGRNILHAGPLRLDTERNQVRCLDKEERLTPRLTDLLRTLMQNAGTVLERKKLFRQVWNTEYTGDTRTLDVHISWLRKAIEENPRQPRFLKTIRGVGYRLDTDS